MMVGVYGQLAYFDYENDFALVAFGSYPIAKDVLLVKSLGILIDALLDASGTEKAAVPANVNILQMIGR